MFATETTSCRATCAWTVVRSLLCPTRAFSPSPVTNATSFCNCAVDHSDAHLRDIVMNFMIAGRDTTAQVTEYDGRTAYLSKLMRARVQTLSWLFYNLSRNQDKEAELLKEIDSFDGGLPDYEELRHMKYITGAINETLRSTIATLIAPSTHHLADVVQLLFLLRLCPPVPVDPKYVVKDDVLPNGYKVPAGVRA